MVFLICEKCGAVGEAASAAVADTIKNASRAAGFVPKTPVIEISGANFRPMPIAVATPVGQDDAAKKVAAEFAGAAVPGRAAVSRVLPGPEDHRSLTGFAVLNPTIPASGIFTVPDVVVTAISAASWRCWPTRTRC